VVADAPLLLLLGEAGTGCPAIDLKGSSEVAVSSWEVTPAGGGGGGGIMAMCKEQRGEDGTGGKLGC
jgi:hypothetical protein